MGILSLVKCFFMYFFYIFSLIRRWRSVMKGTSEIVIDKLKSLKKVCDTKRLNWTNTAYFMFMCYQFLISTPHPPLRKNAKVRDFFEFLLSWCKMEVSQFIENCYISWKIKTNTAITHIQNQIYIYVRRASTKYNCGLSTFTWTHWISLLTSKHSKHLNSEVIFTGTL